MAPTSTYTLVLCEKPEVARRVAEALSEGSVEVKDEDGVEVYEINGGGRAFLICAALGHLYTIEDPSRVRGVYPVFDVEWFPTGLVDSSKERTMVRLKVIKRLAQGANHFICACDFDLEGETIGHNILKYACGGVHQSASRAKFSTLTREELRQAFAHAKPGLGERLAEAGRARHLVDFLWGVNLSRALTEAYRVAAGRHRNITIGRVQGPTLNFLVEREVEVRAFVPIPYWEITAVIEKEGLRFEAAYAPDRLATFVEADAVRRECEGKKAVVAYIKRSSITLPPPAPFNLGDLQREAYRVFGFTPRQTLDLAERLYLSALISYPRTSSQKLPPSINYQAILKGLQRSSAYQSLATELLKRPLKPHEGEKEDPAHPAIYPTGEVPGRPLDARESKVFDLIARRFFSVFAPPGKRERVAASLQVDRHEFRVTGRRTLEEGWLKYYKPYSELEDQPLPPIEEGEALPILLVNVIEKFQNPPPRFNQSSLLEKMEGEGIGTKTTQADIIQTLYERGYVEGESMVATELAFTLVELLQSYAPEVISPQLTRTVEERLDEIQQGGDERNVVQESMGRLLSILEKMWPKRFRVGEDVRKSFLETVRARNLLSPCPVCHTGHLTVIRSRKSGRRFVGCTNYAKGCRASAPLPQKGFLKATGRLCRECGWPVVSVYFSRIPWRLCVNIACPTKKGSGRRVM